MNAPTKDKSSIVMIDKLGLESSRKFWGMLLLLLLLTHQTNVKKDFAQWRESSTVHVAPTFKLNWCDRPASLRKMIRRSHTKAHGIMSVQMALKTL